VPVIVAAAVLVPVSDAEDVETPARAAEGEWVPVMGAVVVLVPVKV